MSDAAPSHLASDLLKSAPDYSSSKPISSGCTSLDTVLDGGFPYNSINGLSGTSLSTLTLTALHAATSHLLSDAQAQAQTTWIDFASGFSPQQFQEVIQERLQEDPSQNTDTMSLLERTYIMPVLDCQGLLEVVAELKQQRLEMRDARSKRDLFVIGNITAIAGATMRNSQIEGNSIMMTLFRMLGGLARDYGACVLILNEVSSRPLYTGGGRQYSALDTVQSVFPQNDFRPALGIMYQYGLDLHCMITPFREGSYSGYGGLPVGKTKPGGRDGNGEATVIEVLQHRNGSLTGRWGVFAVNGAQLN